MDGVAFRILSVSAPVSHGAEGPVGLGGWIQWPWHHHSRQDLGRSPPIIPAITPTMGMLSMPSMYIVSFSRLEWLWVCCGR